VPDVTLPETPEDPTPPGAQDADLVARLRAGEEAAFVEVVDNYTPAMVRLALNYVPSRAVAEEVVQETWLGVLEGIDRFEGRSSLKTWIFRILMNRAMTRGQRERRSVPFSALFDPLNEPSEPSVDPSRFLGSGDPNAGGWGVPPRRWDEIPEDRLLSRETFALIRAAIDTLPPHQREVITLRDVEGWTSVEVCNVLQVSETNQRVLLHRARTKVRRALERYVERGGADGREATP
jgi:RNA polymerase sigma-70 factor (ECF subfamily)